MTATGVGDGPGPVPQGTDLMNFNYSRIEPFAHRAVLLRNRQAAAHLADKTYVRGPVVQRGAQVVPIRLRSPGSHGQRTPGGFGAVSDLTSSDWIALGLGALAVGVAGYIVLKAR